MDTSSLQVILAGIGLLLVVWLPTFGITFAVMSSRHKKKLAQANAQVSNEQMGQDVAVAGAVSLGLAVAISFAAVLVVGVCGAIIAVGFVVVACGGH